MFLLSFGGYFFLERGEWKEKREIFVVASCAPPTGDLVCNPGIWPDWELNPGPFGLHASTQSTEPHQPGLKLLFFQASPVSLVTTTDYYI